MNKLLFTLTLLLLNTDSIAEWTRMDESDENGGYTIYADLTSIGKADDRVKMWTLIDYKIEQEDTGAYFLSKKVRRKYDCRGKHVKELAFKLYSWNMGRGELIRSYSQPQEWKKIQPGSMDETEWKVACNH
ncbi:MAG TPA: hypothetical protein PKM20_02605 [Nitrosomonas sp.]|nr:hypothetical protein [Nitrosomonas sp.]